MPKETNKAKVLTALIETRSIVEASERSGISQETIYRYLRDENFNKDLRDARRSIVQNSVSALLRASVEAVETLKRNMSCENPAVEVRSSQIVLEMAIKGIETIDILDRLETLENRTTNEHKTSTSKIGSLLA